MLFVTILPELYSRDSNGGVRVWQIEVQSNKYRVHAGVNGGTLVTSDWQIVKGKNEGKANATNPNEQALKEATAAYKKKLKEGYYEDITQIDKPKFFQCMLAKEFEDYEDKIDWSQGVGVQIKFNGGRIIASKDGLFTRTGERYVSIPHIEEALKPVFKKYPNAILDGEGFNYDLREKLNELMTILRRTKNFQPGFFEQSREMVRYYIYDGFRDELSFSKLPYKDRKEFIDDDVIKSFGLFPNVAHYVKTYMVYNKETLDVLYEKFLGDNQEGAMIRILNQPYEQKRSKYLLKYKPEDDAEGIIVDIEEGTGNWAGTGKVIWFEWNGKKFKGTFKGTYEQCVKFWKERDKWIGREVTFLYTGLTAYGIPNYARMDYNNCLKK
jgi:DNA ligase-1